MQRAKKNYLIYAVMLLLFGALIYMAIEEGDRFSHHAVASSTVAEDTPFTMFCQFVTDNLHHPLSILLIQIIAVLLMVRLFGFLFKHIGQPGVIGEIVAGIVLGPSVLGYFSRMCFKPFSSRISYQSGVAEPGRTGSFHVRNRDGTRL